MIRVLYNSVDVENVLSKPYLTNEMTHSRYIISHMIMIALLVSLASVIFYCGNFIIMSVGR